MIRNCTVDELKALVKDYKATVKKIWAQPSLMIQWSNYGAVLVLYSPAGTVSVPLNTGALKKSLMSGELQ